MKRRALVGILVGLLMIAGGWIWFNREPDQSESPEGQRVEPIAGEALPGPARNLPRIDRDFDWENADGEDLEDLVEELNAAAKPGAKVFAFDTVVAPGESLLTEGVESEPGIFICTSITPEVMTIEAGEEVVRLAMNRFTVDVSGERKILSAPQIIMQSGSHGHMVISSDEGMYSILVQPEILPDASGFRIRGRESEEKNGGLIQSAP